MSVHPAVQVIPAKSAAGFSYGCKASKFYMKQARGDVQ